MSGVSLHSIIEESISDVDEWLSDNDGDNVSAVLDEIIGNNIPRVTTMLFQLVIDDNALAFEDIDTETETTPFNALFEGVRLRVWREVQNHLQGLDDEEAD